eukprot:g3250.t1
MKKSLLFQALFFNFFITSSSGLNSRIRSPTYNIAAPGSRREKNELFGVHVDRGCMMEMLGAAHPCKNEAGGSNCGQCVLVLAYCKLNPPPISVDPVCMKDCLAINADCSPCVDIQSECEFGALTDADSIAEMNKAKTVVKNTEKTVAMISNDSDTESTWPLSLDASDDVEKALSSEETFLEARGEKEE